MNGRLRIGSTSAQTVRNSAAGGFRVLRHAGCSCGVLVFTRVLSPCVTLFAASIAVAALDGCSDECQSGQVECTDGGIRRCVDPNGDTPGFSPLRWETVACDAPNPYCVVLRTTPTCSAAPGPASECDTPETQFCLHDSVASCEDGFLFSQGACAGTCVAEGGSCAFCDDGTAVADATCAAGATSTCFEGSVYSCTCGERQRKTDDCTSGRSCVTASTAPDMGGMLESFCALSSSPDPLCTTGSSGYCTSRGAVSCRDGYDDSTTACTCVNSVGGSMCGP